MLRNIEEWRAASARIKKIQEFLYIQNPERAREVEQVVQSALDIQLDKDSTINLVRNVFTDPIAAPENINVPFVQQNIDSIVSELQGLPTERFATLIGYTEAMLQSTSPLEYVYMTERSNDLIGVNGVIVEGAIVYVPDVTLLSPIHNKKVISHLKDQNTINLIQHIKWTRKSRK